MFSSVLCKSLYFFIIITYVDFYVAVSKSSVFSGQLL